jgi:3-oxoacyl-(acyl-carrier-protein) synthase
VSGFFVSGWGAVSPAGWGVPGFCEALANGGPLPVRELARPGWERSLRVRAVPPPAVRPAFLAHPRLRRTSPITQYAAAAALEALGADAAAVREGRLRLGVVLCVMTGCVNYSRRFYTEALADPATASPLVFPETVFNAPASHIAALLGTTAINYTLVGDSGMFLQGLALGADWLADDRVDACLVVGAEELDWLSADAFLHFEKDIILSEGAGAVCLRREPIAGRAPQVIRITESHSFTAALPQREAAVRMRAELSVGGSDPLLCLGTRGLPRLDAAEVAAWSGWSGLRMEPKKTLGESLAASGAWQCVAALEALRSGRAGHAVVSIVGVNQQAIGAEFGA